MIINRQPKPLIAAIAVIFGSSLLFLTTATTLPNTAIFATPFFAPEGDGTTTADNTTATTTTTPQDEEEETELIEETTTVEETTTTTPQDTMNDTTTATTTNQTGTTSQGTAEGNITTFNPQSKLPTNVEGCNALASVMEGKAVPDHDLCDVVVYRQAPPIVRSDGIVLNNFSGLGHYIEFVPALVNETGVFPASTLTEEQQQQSSEGNTTVMMPEFTNDNPAVAFGEFALLDEEVIPVREVMQGYNWTETALHHHMLDEFPKMLFLHWTVTGTPNELIEQAREIVEVGTSTYNQTTTSETGISTPSSAGP